MLRLLATNRTNLPFLAPLSTDATVNVTVSASATSLLTGVDNGFVNGFVKLVVSDFGVVTVEAVAFADLVCVAVVMMTFLSCWTLFLFVYLFLFSLGGLCDPRSAGASKDQREIIPLFAVCCTAGSGRHYARQLRYRP